MILRRDVCVLALFSILLALSSQAAEPIKPIRTLPISRDEFMVDCGGKWTASLPDAQRQAGEKILLGLEARTDTAAYGGCNFVLHVAVNGRPLNQPRGWPRLLNKPAVYHLRGNQTDFFWYRRSNNGWSTIFGPGFEEQSVVEGRDYAFLWDISELILPGQANTLTITHLQPKMEEWTKGRGKLAVRNLALHIAEAKAVEAAAQALVLEDKRAPVTVPAIQEVRTQTVGERPYELVWADRKDLPPPLVTFDDLSDWEVVQYDGAQASLERSCEEQIWGDYVGKLTYRLPATTSAILLRPRKPIPIPGEFDCANLWVYGGKDYFLKGGTQIPTVYVQVQDANGETHELSLGDVNQNYWFLQHGKFAPFRWTGECGWPTYESWGGDGNARIEFPASFCGIVISDCRTDGEKTLWLDSLAFYREKRVAPPLPPPPAEPAYPTNSDTILPTCAVKHANAVERQGASFVFTYSGEDGRLRYTVTPTTGTLSDLSASWNDGSPITPMSGGGVLFGDALAPVAAKPTSVELRQDELRTAWETTEGESVHKHIVSYRVRGKTLVVDLESADPSAGEFVFGTARNLTAPKLIDVPYLAMDPVPGPNVLHANGLFILGVLDWYNTNASTFDGSARLVSESEAAFNHGAKYLPLTDGKRNPLRERLFLTISPDFHEVLPNIPNPPSPRLEWASKYIYNMINPPIMPEYLRLLSLYGVDHQLALCWGRIWITRQGDSYTYRVRPRPGVSYEDVTEYAKTVRSYGHVFGLGGGGRDLCPMSKFWDENLVSLGTDGNWIRGWPSNYVVNHIAARRLAQEAGSEIKQRYGPSVFYFDVGTQPSPWRCANDFNARIPGAGMLRSAFRWNCDLMLEFRKYHEFIVSEGGHRWMYAGLSEGDYATIPSRTPPYKRPLLVDFDLLKIHPLQHGVGMGYGPTAFYPADNTGAMSAQAKEDWGREGISRYVAATIAYGHMGCLSGCVGWPFSWTVRYFALIWPLQQEYLTDTVAEIRYHDGEKFVAPSEAMATDAYRKGRLHVRYRRGLEVLVNYHETESWQVSLGGQTYLLPPFGFVARQAGRILACAALAGDRRAEYVESPELIYSDSLLPVVQDPILSADKQTVMRRRGESAWWLIPAGGLGNAHLKPDPQRPFFHDAVGIHINNADCPREVRVNLKRLFPGAAPETVKVFACDSRGEPGQECATDRDGGVLVLHPSADAPRYLVIPAADK